MSRVTNLKQIIDNNDVNIYSIIFELYQDKLNQRGWADVNHGSHPVNTNDIQNIKEPFPKPNKSLDSNDIVISAGGESTFSASMNALNNMTPLAASTSIYNSIIDAFPSSSDCGWLTSTLFPTSHLPEQTIIDRYNLFKRELSIDVLKDQRDSLLEDTEKYISEDYPHKFKSKKDSWKTYRQSIRNLTETIDGLTKPVWSNGAINWGPADGTADLPFDIDMKSFDEEKGTLRLMKKNESLQLSAQQKKDADAVFWTSNEIFGSSWTNSNGDHIAGGFNLEKPDDTDNTGENDKGLFRVTVGDRTDNHYKQIGSNKAFFIDDIEADFLELKQGVYRFDQSHYSNKDYKLSFFIDEKSTQHDTNYITYSGTGIEPGDPNAYVELTVNNATPFTLYYQADGHTGLADKIDSSSKDFMGGCIHVGGTRMPPPLLGLNIDSGSTGNTNLTIKSSNAVDGEAHLTMISDNQEDIGDGFQLKVVNGVFTLSSDHATKETYDKTI